MIFRAYWKRKDSPDGALPSLGYVKAEDKADARRIMEEVLDCSVTEIVDITEAAMHMVTPQSITINFENTSQYHFG